jgi:hypothetical protein
MFLHWRLTPAHKQILQALGEGWVLKAHRDVEGVKWYRLYGLAGEELGIDAGDVGWLFRQKLIFTNHKFPANSYFLTDKGRQIAGILTDKPIKSLGATEGE